MVSHIPLAQQWPAAIEGLGLELLRLHEEAGIGVAWEVTGDNLNVEWMSLDMKKRLAEEYMRDHAALEEA